MGHLHEGGLVAEAVDQVNAVLPDPFRGLDPHRAFPHAVLVLQDHVIPILQAQLSGLFPMDPDLVFRVHFHEDPVVLGAGEGVHGASAVEEAVEARGWLLGRGEDGKGLVARLLESLAVEFDLPRGGAEGKPAFLLPILQPGLALLHQGAHALQGFQVKADALEAGVQVFLNGLPGEELAQAQADPQLPGDPPAGLGVKEGFVGGNPKLDEGGFVGHGHQVVVALQVGGLGQDHVGPHHVLLGEHIYDHVEIQLLEGLLGAGHVGDGVEEVDPVGEEPLDGVGLPGDHGLDELLDGGGAGEELALVGPGFKPFGFVISSSWT
ncbi:hypothetical protein HRbin38_00353 [bacterium HR38]|nr:hypothetical protein HRbin38_00353 [bacterium HR38]